MRNENGSDDMEKVSGVSMDNCLNMNSHCSGVAKRVNMSLGCLNKKNIK